MKKIWWVLLIIWSSNSFYAQKGTITIDLGSFEEVKAFDGISVNLIKSDTDKAVISGENTNKVALVNKDGVLKIRMEIDKIFSGFRTFVDLHHSQPLKIIDVNEDAVIGTRTPIIQDVIELRAQEGGEINISCQVEQLLAKAVTGGDIIIKGFTKFQDIQINTGGTFNGRVFKSEFTTIAVNAGGNAEIYATKYAKVDVKAGGKIKVYGNPEKIDEKKVLGGSIERMN